MTTRRANRAGRRGPLEASRGICGLAAPLAFVVLAAGVAGGCGGGDPQPEEPQAAEEPGEPTEDALIPQRRFVEIRQLFDRRRPATTRCYNAAIAQGELTEEDSGHVTVGMVITEEGRATELEILDAALASETLHECVMARIRQWNFGELPRPLDYSYSYHFETL